MRGSGNAPGHKNLKGEKKMTLYELMHNTTVQGDIRISTWVDGEEKDALYLKNCDDLNCPEIPDGWEDREVFFLFCPGDGYLHIEIDGEEE